MLYYMYIIRVSVANRNATGVQFSHWLLEKPQVKITKSAKVLTWVWGTENNMARQYAVQWSLTYPDYSLIRTYVLEQIMIIYRKSDSLIWIFNYPDSQLGNEGVRISGGPLYISYRIQSYPCAVCHYWGICHPCPGHPIELLSLTWGSLETPWTGAKVWNHGTLRPVHHDISHLLYSTLLDLEYCVILQAVLIYCPIVLFCHFQYQGDGLPGNECKSSNKQVAIFQWNYNTLIENV